VVRVMWGRLIACVMIASVPSSFALAQTHQQICVPAVINGQHLSIVSKEKLAKAILNQNPNAQTLYINADAPGGDSAYQPQWRRIFTDPHFCSNNAGCLSKNDKTGKMDDSAAEDTLGKIQLALSDFIQTQTTDRKFYATANPTIGATYLLGGDTVNVISCIGPELPPVAKAAPGISAGPLRLRLSSDDLNIDAKQDGFKALKPATATLTRDGVANKTSVAAQASLGYAIPLDFAVPPSVKYITAEAVPYLSTMQSYTKVDRKPANYGDTNNLAVGALFDANITVVGDALSVNNVISLKPQYLWNTSDKSEIASLRFRWQPWTQNVAGPPVTINTPFPLGLALDGYYAQILFDLRLDSGFYANKGTNPATIASHSSFARGGSMFGFALTTPALGPFATLNVTETLLDGFKGPVRTLSLFQSTVSYYFDSTGNIGVSFQYKNGRDEDTTEYAQTYTLGLAAKF
jgi:hypothetical protein